jgi:hypothetical protein
MFAQPLAWLGLVGLAVPIAIHLLARHQAVRSLFPSLRFIAATDVTFIKRQRLTDIALLIVRLAIVTAAVAAIAGPRAPQQTTTGTGPLARAVVIDITESSGGARADSAAMTAARAAVGDASTSMLIETRSLGAGIASASAWLAAETGRRELVVVSDFQAGSIDDRDLDAVPAGVGLRFTAVPTMAQVLPQGLQVTDERSRMSWAAVSGGRQLPVEIKAGRDQMRADAMLAAVASVSAASIPDGGHRAIVVFPSAPEHDQFLATSAPINQPWMFDAIRPVMDDQSLRRHVQSRAAGDVLAVLFDLDPSSADAAAAVSLILKALQQPLPAAELEPRMLPAEALQRWERPAASVPVPNLNAPQGRWLWLVALVLLGVETWMRRRRVPNVMEERPHARVA